MAKTYYKTLVKVGKFQIDLQRYNKGFKNLKSVYYKSGIRRIWNECGSIIQIGFSNYRLLLIRLK